MRYSDDLQPISNGCLNDREKDFLGLCNECFGLGIEHFSGTDWMIIGRVAPGIGRFDRTIDRLLFEIERFPRTIDRFHSGIERFDGTIERLARKSRTPKQQIHQLNYLYTKSRGNRDPLLHFVISLLTLAHAHLLLPLAAAFHGNHL